MKSESLWSDYIRRGRSFVPTNWKRERLGLNITNAGCAEGGDGPCNGFFIGGSTSHTAAD